MSTRRAAAVAGVVILAAGAIVVAASVVDGDRVVEEEIGAVALEHVHGLAVDEGGDVLAGTHFGLHRLRDGRLELVGVSYQDLMGFSVAADGSFVASGHPDIAGIRRGDPGRLGFIRSVNGGRSWRSVGLAGEADLHAIESSGGLLYGWDATSGRVLASVDGKSWEERSVIELSSLAADPADPERLLASASSGTLVSDDGGRTWRPIQAPPVVVVDWSDEGGVWGIDATGGVFSATDPEEAWKAQGQLGGEPQALVVDRQRVVAAVSAEGGVRLLERRRDARWRVLASSGQR
jgi:hypothetical protein